MALRSRTSPQPALDKIQMTTEKGRLTTSHLQRYVGVERAAVRSTLRFNPMWWRGRNPPKATSTLQQRPQDDPYRKIQWQGASDPIDHQTQEATDDEVRIHAP